MSEGGAIADLLGEGVFALGRDGRFDYLNPAAERLLGRDAAGLLGERFGDWLGVPAERCGVLRALRRGETVRADEAEFPRGDGGRLKVAYVATPRHGDGGVAVLFRDVGREQAQAEALHAARRRAEEASVRKSQFLAAMSHDIRTPLNAIIGMAELLSDTSLDGEQRRYVDIFRSAGDSLLALINDILDLSKVEAGQLTLDSTEFSLRGLVDGVVEILASRARDKGVALRVRMEPGLPARVGGDPARLRQVLLNLLGNAVKFTERGGVELRVEHDPLFPDRGRLRFSVSDTGVGIPASRLEAIFDPFAQADSAVARKYGGTGLGLAICRQLVEAMGGGIEVESRPGAGSRFRFSVPLWLGEVADEAATRRPLELRGLRMLMVEGSPVSRMVVRELLEAEGVAVEWLGDCRQASQVVAAAEQVGNPYDVVLLDCHSRGVDSFELASGIGDRHHTRGTPMVMLSAERGERALSRARALGLVYLLKPIKRAELLGGIATALGCHWEVRGEAYGALWKEDAVPLEAPPPGRPLRILLAEDDADNQVLIGAFLKPEGHRLVVVGDGREAVARFERETFDLVLMDVQMPHLDGYQATARIRRLEQAAGRRRTPILALTAHALEEDRRRSLEAGCDGHLSKPVSRIRLLEEIGFRVAETGLEFG
ncbi:response regulator [Endothiovibrio diazotrophicus]